MKIPYQFLDWAEKTYGSDLDKIDIEHEYDSSLSFAENKTLFKEKFNTAYFSEKEQLNNALAAQQRQDAEELKPDYTRETKYLKMLCKKSLIILIVGARGSGKSALGFNTLEALSKITKRHICTVGFPKQTPFKDYAYIEAVPNGAIALIDEGSRSYDARRALSSKNIYMSNEMRLARHNDLTLIYVTQNSADIDVRTLRYADVLLLKRPSVLQLELERGPIKKIYESIGLFKDDDPERDLNTYYVFSDELKGAMTFELPSFWTELISKAYKKKEAVRAPSLLELIKEKMPLIKEW